MYFRLCLHVDTSSLRLFMVARGGFVIIRCFSAVHKPHRLVVLEYGFALARILHVIVKALFSLTVPTSAYSVQCHFSVSHA